MHTGASTCVLPLNTVEAAQICKNRYRDVCTFFFFRIKRRQFVNEYYLACLMAVGMLVAEFVHTELLLAL